MAYLTEDELFALQQALAAIPPAYTTVRDVLLSGIPVPVRGQIPFLAGAGPNFQALADLRFLSDIPRLTDGSVPLETFLRSLVAQTRGLPIYDLFREQLDKVSAMTTGAPRISDQIKANVPAKAVQILEEIVQQDDMLPFSFLKGGVRAGNATARVTVRRFENGKLKTLSNGLPYLGRGTGWMIANDLLITNYHVIGIREATEADASEQDFRLQGGSAIVEFDLDADGMVSTDIQSSEVVASDKERDYAILRLAKAPENRSPLRLAPGQVQISEETLLAANIIQHPGGKFKRVALRNNVIYRAPFPDLLYFTDTERGSSGAPVFDDQWRVIALHKRSESAPNVMFNGQKAGYVNVGTQVESILDHLRDRFRDIRTKIG